MLVKWEARDPQVYLLWTTMNGWVYAGFDQTYAQMGVSFDKLYYESDTFLLGKDQVMEGLKSGVFYQKPDGSVWIDLTADGLDEKLGIEESKELSWPKQLRQRNLAELLVRSASKELKELVRYLLAHWLLFGCWPT